MPDPTVALEGPLQLDVPLSALQHRALARWNAAWRETEDARAATTLRELRIDLDRRLDVLRRQRTAMLDHVAGGARPVRLVVAHRDARASRRCADAVQGVLPGARGAAADVRALDNGAEAVGVALVAQPSLVVVDAPLPMMTALDVVAEIRRYAPGALLVACDDGVGAADLRAAGAAATYRRGTPAPRIAELAAQALAGGPVEVPEPRP